MKEKCQSKGCNETKNLCEHHYKFKSLAEDKKQTGSVVTLCRKHHDILHYKIITWVFWKFVPKEKRDECRNFIESKTKEELGIT